MRLPRPPLPAALAALAALAACGTQAPAAGGDQNLPNAGVGPFRPLRKGETPAVPAAPLLLSDSFAWSAPFVVDLDADPSTPALALFAVAGDGVSLPKSIQRYELPDGRSPGNDRRKVLEHTGAEGWEGAEGVDHPAVLRSGGLWVLYYSSGRCIGRAVSADQGVTFVKRAEGPVLCGAEPGAPPWEDGALRAPSLHLAADGQIHLLYESGGRVGEAVSADGEHFARASAAPVFAPSRGPAAAPVDGGPDEPFDDAAVGEPFALAGVSGIGRPLTYLYYTAVNGAGVRAIGLAARAGDSGPFTRNPVPILTRFQPRGPVTARVGEVTLLFASCLGSEFAPDATLAILGAVAPASASLPPVTKDGG